MNLGRVGLRVATLTQGHQDTTMTEQETALRELLAKGTDASVLREMIGFAAERLMELEIGGMHWRRARRAQRRTGWPSATAIATETGRRAPAPSNCAYPQAAGAAATSLPFSSPGAPPRRR